MALLLTHAAQLLTLEGPGRARRGAEMGELGLIADGALLMAEGAIVRAGPTDRVARGIPPELGAVEERDCRGLLLAPGLCDSHTHLVFAAPRLEDYERRLAGASYEQIAASGGGIRLSVASVRAAAEADLGERAAHWMRTAQRHGTTTLEVKSGYGLSTEAEGKSLRAAHAAALATGLEAPRTFLGAHIVPPEWQQDRRGYLRLLEEQMLPAVMKLGVAVPEFADVFCDPAGFAPAESRQILMAARAHGLQLKLHAEQLAHSGGIGLGVELGAVSVDHCDHAQEADAQLLARSATVATLIPGANWFLGQPYPPARMLLQAGAALALATDFNPGTCPILSLPLIMGLACSQLRLTPAQAWTAATINGAAALNRAALCGSLQAGKRADVAVFAAEDYRAVPYYAGQNLCTAVVQNGVWISNHATD